MTTPRSMGGARPSSPEHRSFGLPARHPAETNVRARRAGAGIAGRFPLALAATLLAFLGAAATSHADTLVSNRGNSASGSVGLGIYQAQGFETGNRHAGYKLDAVEVRLERPSGSTRGIRVELRTENTNGRPGSRIFWFLDREVPSGTNHVRFEAPGGTRLAAMTTYFIRMRQSGGSGSDLHVHETDEYGQSGFDNWSIANEHWWHDGASWHDDDEPFRIKVIGENADGQPYVTGVARGSSPAGGTWNTSQNIRVTVTFSEDVDVTGAPRLPLDIGGTTRYATAAAATDTDTVHFDYTVQAADFDADGFEVAKNTLALNGGTILRADATVAADLDHPALAADDGHTVNDIVIEEVAMVSEAPHGRIYTLGDHIEIGVTFNQSVAVTGTPQLAICVNRSSDDCDEKQADYNRGTGSETLVFRYTVQAGDRDNNGIFIDDDAVSLNGGAITQAGSTTRDANLDHSRPGTQGDHRVSALAEIIGFGVTVTSSPRAAPQTYGRGERIDITVTFGAPVNATANTDFVLSAGGRKRAALLRGSGTKQLMFGYTVQAGDEDDDGIWIGDEDATLVGNRSGTPQNGTITSMADGTAATLNHSALGVLSAHKVDGSRVLPVKDARLSALSLGTGVTLSPTFASGTTTYTASVANSVDAVTVTPTTNHDDATIEYLDSSDNALADADTNTAGHQVALEVGNTVFTVKVTSEDGTTTQAYTVTVTRQATAPPHPQADLLVSNNGIGIAGTIEFAVGNFQVATMFTAGDNPQGYALSSATITVAAANTAAGAASLAIYDVSGSNPGTKLFELSGNVASAGASTWDAPADSVLKTDTNYFLVVSKNTAGNRFSIAGTEDDGQSGLNEWSIADSSRQTNILGGWLNLTSSLVMTLTGREIVGDDATLSALSLGTGVTLSPTFASGTTAYTASVANSVDEVTVTPTTTDSDATVEYLDASDTALADADTNAAGHQVALDVGDTVFKVKVTAEDGTTTQTYTVTVTRTPPTGGVVVTLDLSEDESFEDAGRVTVMATASLASPEAFTVEISASPVAPATDDDFELSANRTLSFAANATESTGTVTISPVSDEDPEPNDVVTVSGVVSNPAIPNPEDVRLTILNDDADLPQDIAIDAPAAVDEGAGTANVTVTLTTGQNTAPAIDAQLFYRPRSETATSGDDYTRPQGLGNRIAIVPVSAFSANADGTAWVARHSFEIGIVDDGEAEPEETIKFAIYTNSNNSGTKQTIRIRDNDTPVMRNVRVVNGPGEAGMWSAGEQVELEVRYTLPVAVEQPSSYYECWSYNADGTCRAPDPYVAVVFRSDARPGYGEVLGVAPARYVSGSGTDTLRFAYTVGAAEAGARGVEVVDGKVLLRGATIRPLGGGAAELSEFTRTRVMRVTVRKPGGGAWTAGDKVRVRVRFTGPGQQQNKDKVDVNKTGGTPTIGLLLGDPQNRPLARTASYEGGSGSSTLEFEYAVTAGDGRISAVEVVADSLELSGATIRNKDGYDADLDHPGVVWSSSLALSVRDTAANEGGTLRFTMELAQASKAPVTVDYETADGTATAGQDYTAKRGTVTFAPGRTRKTVAVPVLRDEAAEDAETVVLRLSNVRAEGSEEPVEVTDPEAEGTIEDGASEGLTASFEGLPEAHDGERAFRFRVAFSEPIGISFRSLREDAFAVTGGRVTRGRRVDDRRDLFEMTVEPDGAGEVTITLPAGRECSVSGAICTKGENRRQLTNTPTATVVGPPVVPLTASFVGVPAEHDGERAFTLRLAFSERVGWMNARRLREHVVAVAGGRATKAGRVNRRRDLWKLTVEPDSLADVTVTLAAGAACRTPAAVCTSDGRALSHTIATTVRGPVAVSVADARAEEGTDATLDFAVTLSRAASGAVAVAYTTADGTATAGADYTARKGQLTFAPGETETTVRVPVLDDAHDEGEETLTLRLSAASGAVLADGTATGTIVNSDKLQQAWLARFGRTVATHVTDAVGDRLRGTPGQDSHLTVGGYRLPLGQRGATDGADDGVSGVERLVLALGQRLGLGTGPAPAGTGGWPDATDPRLGQSRTLDVGSALNLRQVLLGSSFRLALGGDAVGARNLRLTAWGRVAGTTFDGQDGPLSLNGDVLTGTVGVDGEWDRLLAGLAVAHSRGDGSYTNATPDMGARGRGDLEQTLTSVHPYLRYAVTDRLAVWGLLGFGMGQMEMEVDTDEIREADTDLLMGAFGGRGILLSAADSGGFQLATRTDAMLTRTTSDAVAGMASGDAEAHRLRLVLEGSRGFTWAEGRRLTPTMEVGLRHDWGDAETGFGLELGGRVQYADPALGLTIDATVRGLLAHEDSDYQEWGASGTVRVVPGAGGHGLSLTLAPAWGATASGVDGLWSRQTTAGLAPQGTRQTQAGRLNAEVGYGFAPFGTGLLTPYAGTVLSDGADRTYRVGGRLQMRGGWATGLALNLEGMRQEPAGQQPVNQGLRLQITWGF